MDANCQLIRTRANKQSLGCDGVLEFVSRKEQISPQAIVDLICANPELFTECKLKYANLVLHSIVLAILGFKTALCDGIQLSELYYVFSEMYPCLKHEWSTVEEWIVRQFNSTHKQAFYDHPYYEYADGKFKITIKDGEI